MNDLEDEGEKKVKPKRRGCFVYEDDLEVGQLLAVHSLKHTNDTANIMGQAFRVTGVCLPFFIGVLPGNQIFTFDTRYVNVMRVTEEFAKVQAPQAPKP